MMRLLVCCRSCDRQFDASETRGGSRFRCHCGEVVTVPRPEPQDARVVRCSSCGGTRQKDEVACKYCSATYTLHERDLHTLCPKCMTRISDAARFCHACGTAIAVRSDLGRVTPHPCPVCADEGRLTHRTLSRDDGSSVAVLECPRCAGLWLESPLFEGLVREARQVAPSVAERSVPAEETRFPTDRRPPASAAPQAGPMYRRCVVCRQMMSRRNYGHRSGVIIDVCPAHGIWFDAHELERILLWLRSGGTAKTEVPRPREDARSVGLPCPGGADARAAHSALEGAMDIALGTIRLLFR